MTAANPSAIVDVAMNDLTAHSGLNPRNTRRYAEPTIIPPDLCPLLAVWCENTEYRLLTGGLGEIAYERTHTVNIGWYDAIRDEADTGGTGDPTEVQNLDQTAEALVKQAANWASGLPGFGPELVATLASRALEPQAGTIWRALIVVHVNDAA